MQIGFTHQIMRDYLASRAALPHWRKGHLPFCNSQNPSQTQQLIDHLTLYSGYNDPYEPMLSDLFWLILEQAKTLKPLDRLVSDTQAHIQVRNMAFAALIWNGWIDLENTWQILDSEDGPFHDLLLSNLWLQISTRLDRTPENLEAWERMCSNWFDNARSEKGKQAALKLLNASNLAQEFKLGIDEKERPVLLMMNNQDEVIGSHIIGNIVLDLESLLADDLVRENEESAK